MVINRRQKITRYSVRTVISACILLGTWFLVNSQRTLLLEIFATLQVPFQKEYALSTKDLRNRQIDELNAEIAELKTQNAQLKSLFKYSEDKPQNEILAPVIARTPDQWWDQIIIGRGQNEGIQVGYIVCGLGGLVGRVIEVTPNTSRVLLLSNPESTLGAIVSRSRSMGVVKGKGNSQATMQFFQSLPDIKVGDSVMSSNVSQLFPPGYFIGYISSINTDKGPAPEAIIQLTSTVKSLEWVVVYPFNVQQ